ncbi:RNA polymerase sigma factor [Paenibacillus sp. SYP-B4298]|uniref:RNA polymerase sigma factor n=1 Tax=Paenibacillus sp. SYP-B4298 TaxID=2996034 RepID=UPI0022DDD2CA|nr:sigma-70 family RNA polymerase sigma factor [Paenibacillus sp. SYP-B4298]
MEQWFNLIRNRFDNLNIEIQKVLYVSYYQFVYRDIYFMLREHAFTEDVIQDTFMKMITKGPMLPSNSNIPAWIKQVARHTAIDYLRRIHKETKLVEGLYLSSRELSGEDSVAKVVENKWRDEILHQAIKELKPDYQKLLRLFYFDGNTYKEIGLKLHIKETVLTQRMTRARKKLLQLFLQKCNGSNDRNIKYWSST